MTDQRETHWRPNMPAPIDVYFALPRGSLILDWAGPAEAFRIANLEVSEHAERRTAAFELHFVAPAATSESSVGALICCLKIALDRRYTARKRLRLRIAYRTKWVNHSDPNNLWGSTGKGLRFHLPSSTEPQRRPQIWASGDPKANRYWFPTLHAPGQLRTSELRATVKAPLRMVAGGRLLRTIDNTDGTRTFHWATRTPEPEHRTTLAVGEFSGSALRAGRVRLHNLGHPDEASGVAASVVQLPDTLRFLERLTGQRYPQPSYTQVFVQDLP